MKRMTRIRRCLIRLRAALLRRALLPPEVHYVSGGENLPPPLTAEAVNTAGSAARA